MPPDAVTKLDQNIWSELTKADAKSFTAIHRGGAEVVIQARVAGSPPTDGTIAGLPIKENGFIKKPLSEISHVSGVNRLWGRPIGGPAWLYVQTD